MKAVIYARVSSTTDRQNTERQVKDLTQYANAMSMDVVGVFEEKISGAKTLKERPVLQEALEYCNANGVEMLLVSELSRLGRNAFDVLDTIQYILKSPSLNLYMQKEQFTLRDKEGNPSMFAPIMLATLATCAQLERDAIKFRLCSGRAAYIEKGGKLGRKLGSVKSIEQKASEYKEVIRELKRGTSIRRTAKLCDVSPTTVQMVKKDFQL